MCQVFLWNTLLLFCAAYILQCSIPSNLMSVIVQNSKRVIVQFLHNITTIYIALCPPMRGIRGSVIYNISKFSFNDKQEFNFFLENEIKLCLTINILPLLKRVFFLRSRQLPLINDVQVLDYNYTKNLCFS